MSIKSVADLRLEKWDAIQTALDSGKSWSDVLSMIDQEPDQAPPPKSNELIEAAETAAEFKREPEIKGPAEPLDKESVAETPTKSEEGTRMAREFYKPEVKAAILKAVSEARASGKKFEDQYKAAANAGYKGGEGALRVLISKAGIAKGKRRGRGKAKAAPAPVAAAPAKRRGRPAKAAAVARGGGLADVERLIEAEVSSRINAAIDEAIKALSALKQ